MPLDNPEYYSTHAAPSLRNTSVWTYVALAVIIFLVSGVVLYSLHSCYVSALYQANARMRALASEEPKRLSSANWKSRFKRNKKESGLRKLLLQPSGKSGSAASLIPTTGEKSLSSSSSSMFTSPPLPINYPTPRLASNPFNANMHLYLSPAENMSAQPVPQEYWFYPVSNNGVSLPAKCYDPEDLDATRYADEEQENIKPISLSHNKKKWSRDSGRNVGKSERKCSTGDQENFNPSLAQKRELERGRRKNEETLGFSRAMR